MHVAHGDDAPDRFAGHGVKDGANGAVLARGGLLLREPGRTLDPVDTTGAGDSFNAGYLASYLAGEDDATALRWACATGAAATQTAGGCAGPLTTVSARPYVRNGLS